MLLVTGGVEGGLACKAFHRLSILLQWFATKRAG